MANSPTETEYDNDYWLDTEHNKRKAWMEANGLDEPYGCKNPLDILILLEVTIELELNN